MATGKSLELREIHPQPVVIPGTEVTPIFRTPTTGGDPVFVGRWLRPMPYVGASRDRSLPGKARIRARRAQRVS